MTRATNAKREEASRRIQTLEIIDRMNSCALGKMPMEATELRCAEVLLRKTLPDLKALEAVLDAEHNGEIRIKIT
jgi:hypothetical protein